MKPKIKIKLNVLAKFACVLLAAGVVFSAFGLFKGPSYYFYIDTSGLHTGNNVKPTEVKEELERFSSVDISAKFDSVIIESGDSYSVDMSFCQPHVVPVIEIENSVLKISAQVDDKKAFEKMVELTEPSFKSEITVTIPENVTLSSIIYNLSDYYSPTPKYHKQTNIYLQKISFGSFSAPTTHGANVNMSACNADSVDLISVNWILLNSFKASDCVISSFKSNYETEWIEFNNCTLGSVCVNVSDEINTQKAFEQYAYDNDNDGSDWGHSLAFNKCTVGTVKSGYFDVSANDTVFEDAVLAINQYDGDAGACRFENLDIKNSLYIYTKSDIHLKLLGEEKDYGFNLKTHNEGEIITETVGMDDRRFIYGHDTDATRSAPVQSYYTSDEYEMEILKSNRNKDILRTGTVDSVSGDGITQYFADVYSLSEIRYFIDLNGCVHYETDRDGYFETIETELFESHEDFEYSFKEFYGEKNIISVGGKQQEGESFIKDGKIKITVVSPESSVYIDFVN